MSTCSRPIYTPTRARTLLPDIDTAKLSAVEKNILDSLEKDWQTKFAVKWLTWSDKLRGKHGVWERLSQEVITAARPMALEDIRKSLSWANGEVLKSSGGVYIDPRELTLSLGWVISWAGGGQNTGHGGSFDLRRRLGMDDLAERGSSI